MISASLTKDIQVSCEQIADHISKLTDDLGTVHSMTLIFKLDARERLALLACTNIKLNIKDQSVIYIYIYTID